MIKGHGSKSTITPLTSLNAVPLKEEPNQLNRNKRTESILSHVIVGVTALQPSASL